MCPVNCMFVVHFGASCNHYLCGMTKKRRERRKGEKGDSIKIPSPLISLTKKGDRNTITKDDWCNQRGAWKVIFTITYTKGKFKRFIHFADISVNKIISISMIFALSFPNILNSFIKWNQMFLFWYSSPKNNVLQ